MDITKIGIVMPCINLWGKYTRPALDSVTLAISEAAKHNIYCDILLVDNGSTDETKTAASDYFRARWNEATAKSSYHRNEEMWGFQRSVNFGVNEFFNNRKYDYVLVLNNDIVLHKNAIWRLVERFKKGGVAMATCLDVTGECLRNPSNITKVSDAEKAACPESPHPCFSAFMVNRECWDKVGEFDEVFFPAYYEDNDYHYRMKLAGLLAVTYPPALFFHWGSATQSEALGRPLTDSGNQHAQFVRKWGAGPGQEVWGHPYNDDSLPITRVKQTKA